MVITGRTVFKIVYFLNLIVQVLFVLFNLSMGKALTSNYLILSLLSISATSVIYILLERDKKKVS